jgi:hypothetical protein
MRRLVPNAGWLAAAFPPVVINMILGQNGFLTAALFAGGTVLLPRRPFVAGLVFGLLVIKAASRSAVAAGVHRRCRQWRAFAGAAVGAIGALLLALLAFGPAPYLSLVEMVPLYGSIMREGFVPWHKMASVYAALSALGVSPTAAFAAHGVVATIAAAMVWRVWRSDAEPIAKAAVLAGATLLVSPYLYAYDMLLLVLPFLWLLGQGQRGALVVVLWCLPLISLLQDWGLYDRIDPLPIVSAGVLLLVWRRLAATASEQSRPAESAAA